MDNLDSLESNDFDFSHILDDIDKMKTIKKSMKDDLEKAKQIFKDTIDCFIHCKEHRKEIIHQIRIFVWKSARPNLLANMIMASANVKERFSGRTDRLSCCFLIFYFLCFAAFFGSMIYYYLYESCKPTTALSNSLISSETNALSFNSGTAHICSSFIPSIKDDNPTNKTTNSTSKAAPVNLLSSQDDTGSGHDDTASGYYRSNDDYFYSNSNLNTSSITYKYNQECLLSGLSCHDYGLYYKKKCPTTLCDDNVACSISTSGSVSVTYLECGSASTAVVNSIQYCFLSQLLIIFLFILFRSIYKETKDKDTCNARCKAVCSEKFARNIFRKLFPIIEDKLSDAFGHEQ